MNKAIPRGLRTLLQLIAAGGLTGLVTVIADGLPGNTKAIVLAVSTLAVAFAQNFLEDAGTVPTLLPDNEPAP